MRRTVPPTAEIEDQIDELLVVGVGENPREALSELAKQFAALERRMPTRAAPRERMASGLRRPRVRSDR